MDQSTSVQSPSEAVQKEDKNLATLIHVGGIFFGFLPALIVFLLKKEEASPWLLQQLKEALNFQLTILIASVGALVLSFLLIGAFLIPIILIINFVFCLIAAIKTSSGEEYRYPLSIRLVQ